MQCSHHACKVVDDHKSVAALITNSLPKRGRGCNGGVALPQGGALRCSDHCGVPHGLLSPKQGRCLLHLG